MVPYRLAAKQLSSQGSATSAGPNFVAPTAGDGWEDVGGTCTLGSSLTLFVPVDCPDEEPLAVVVHSIGNKISRVFCGTDGMHRSRVDFDSHTHFAMKDERKGGVEVRGSGKGGG